MSSSGQRNQLVTWGMRDIHVIVWLIAFAESFSLFVNSQPRSRWAKDCYDCFLFTLNSCSSLPVTYELTLPLTVIDVGLPSSYPKCQFLDLSNCVHVLSYKQSFLFFLAELEECPEASHPTINGLVLTTCATAHMHPSLFEREPP